jgi:hypothetical protein
LVPRQVISRAATCACGGSCPRCKPDASQIQTNLAIGAPGGNFNVAERCLTHAFAAGDFFAIEGVFWHLANGTETKTEIAARWGVTVTALDRAARDVRPNARRAGGDDRSPGEYVGHHPVSARTGDDALFLHCSNGTL